MQRLGILGGTFNPPHLGHLAIARCAREQLGLDLVMLMPARIPPHKPSVQDPGPEHRLHMCRLAIAGQSGLEVCSQEIEREGPSYTVDTLGAMHDGHPDARLTFILGADAAATLPTWREPGRVLELADLAVAARPGVARQAVLRALAPLVEAPGGGDRGAGAKQASGDARRSPGVRFLQMPVIEISSSTVRRRASRGEPIEDLVGPAVAGYIADHELYRRAIAVHG